MEKILNSSFRTELDKCLEEAGISTKEREKIISKRYKDALKSVVLNRLNTIFNAIQEDDYKSLSYFIKDSPAGDGYGTDNRYISFSDISECEDIGDVIDSLSSLNEKLITST